MKTKHLIILYCIVPVISLAQELNDSLLTAFYNRTLSYYFSDSITYQDQKLFGCILIKTELNSSGLIKKLGQNKFFYFNDSTPEYSLLIKPYKKNIDRKIYWINHKLFAPDTIDVNIGGWTIENASRKNLSLALWCSGGMGYIPDQRFIFNKPTGIWAVITSKEIIDQRLIEVKAKMNNE